MINSSTGDKSIHGRGLQMAPSDSISYDITLSMLWVPAMVVPTPPSSLTPSLPPPLPPGGPRPCSEQWGEGTAHLHIPPALPHKTPGKRGRRHGNQLTIGWCSTELWFTATLREPWPEHSLLSLKYSPYKHISYLFTCSTQYSILSAN